jgi:hypothetical protein
MCNTLVLVTPFLLAYLIFKNKYILVIGGIVSLISYFNYREGMSAAQRKALINKSAKLKSPVVKKNAPTKPAKIVAPVKKIVNAKLVAPVKKTVKKK